MEKQTYVRINPEPLPEQRAYDPYLDGPLFDQRWGRLYDPLLDGPFYKNHDHNLIGLRPRFVPRGNW